MECRPAHSRYTSRKVSSFNCSCSLSRLTFLSRPLVDGLDSIESSSSSVMKSKHNYRSLLLSDPLEWLSYIITRLFRSTCYYYCSSLVSFYSIFGKMFDCLVILMLDALQLLYLTSAERQHQQLDVLFRFLLNNQSIRVSFYLLFASTFKTCSHLL